MSLLPTDIKASSSQDYFAPNLPAGVTYGLAWAVYPSTSCLVSNIPLPSVTTSSALSVSLQPRVATTQTIADAANCWLVEAQPVAGVGIQVLIYAGGTGTNSGPVNTTDFGISWAVTKL